MTLPWRRIAGPALATAVMLVVLVGLGVWQVRRLAWKEALLAQIAAASAAPPVPLPRAPGAFQRAWAEGRLDPALQVRFGAEVRDTPQGPLLGEQTIVPLRRAGELPVLVDLGWVPEHARAAVPDGPVRVTGFVRAPETPSWLSASDDPRGRRFYTLEPAAMAAALGLPEVAPLTLVATAPPVPAPVAGAGTVAPIPVGAPPEPPNNHLSYALTWFGLAATLLAVFVVWTRRALGEGQKESSFSEEKEAKRL